MRPLALAFSLVLPLAASAGALTSLHPEEGYPDDAPLLASPGDYAELFKQVQERLRAQGFDAGPVNGDWTAKTQTALAQFQRANDLPASGSLDQRTLNELGVDLGLSLSGGE